MTDFTLQTNCTLHQAGQLRADTQSETSPTIFLAETQITLHKRLEDLGVDILRNAGTGIFHLEFER